MTQLFTAATNVNEGTRCLCKALRKSPVNASVTTKASKPALFTYTTFMSYSQM